MAIDATTVWEVRATGSSVNGGGFVDRDPGTSVDYSQQDAAQLSVADLATDGAGTALSSATGGFTAAMAGNVIQISGGDLTAGWYEITAYTDTNNVTIDRSAGASKSGGTGNVGGAFNFGTTLDDDFVEAFENGNTCYIESGSYSLGESIYTLDAGTGDLPFNIIGYITSRATVPYGDDRPLITCGNSEIATYTYTNIRNLRATGTGTTIFISVGGVSLFVNCKAVNTSGVDGRIAFKGTNGTGQFIGCEGESTNGYAFYTGSALHCYAHDSVRGFHGMGSVRMCVADTCSDYGIYCTLHSMYENNVIYNCGTGFYASTVSQCDSILNTIIDGCTTGIDATAAFRELAVINCVLNNTTDFAANVAHCIQIGNIIGDPEMTAPADGDFTIGTGSNAYKAGFDITDYIASVTI